MTGQHWQHIDGCNLPTDHQGACRLARPFRIRPGGGRGYVGGQDSAERVADALRPILDAHGVTPEVAAWVLDIPEQQAAGILADLARADASDLYALAGYCRTRLSDVARAAGL